MTRITSTLKIQNRLPDLRNTQGLTQQELADAVGVTRATILALERGDYNPSLELAYRLSKFFELKIDDLFQFKLK
jgi:putative transcriptional regulator